MKKTIFTLSALTAITLVGCSLPDVINKNQTNPITEIPSSIFECKTIEEATQLVGFSIVLPETIANNFKQQRIEVISNQTIQIIYNDGNQEIIIRKAFGNEDISGVYTDNSENTITEIDEAQVTLKDYNGEVKVATWSKNAYSYSVTIHDDTEGLTFDTMVDIITNID